MTEKKTSEAQLKATREWEKRNPDKVRISGYRRTARLFIRKHTTLDDLLELEGLIAERKRILKEPS